MTYLISIIVAIALTGTLFFLYSSSLSERTFVVQNNIIKAENHFLVLKKGFDMNFMYTNRALDISNWEEEISRYINIPDIGNDYELSYNENINGRFFCLLKRNEGMDNVNFETYESFALKNEYAYIGQECGIIENHNFNNNYSDVAVTFYVGR